jgi:hypothetical protein
MSQRVIRFLDAHNNHPNHPFDILFFYFNIKTVAEMTCYDMLHRTLCTTYETRTHKMSFCFYVEVVN